MNWLEYVQQRSTRSNILLTIITPNHFGSLIVTGMDFRNQMDNTTRFSLFDTLSVVSFIITTALLYNIAITKMDLTKATIFSNLIPVYTIGFAFWLLDESLTSSQLMACGLILPGVVLGQSRRRKAPLNAAQEAVE